MPLFDNFRNIILIIRERIAFLLVMIGVVLAVLAGLVFLYVLRPVAHRVRRVRARFANAKQ